MNYRCQANLQCLPVPMPMPVFMFLLFIFFLQFISYDATGKMKITPHTHSPKWASKKWKWMIYYFAHKLPKSQCLGFSARSKIPGYNETLQCINEYANEVELEEKYKSQQKSGRVEFHFFYIWAMILLYCPLQMFIQFARKKTTTTTKKITLTDAPSLVIMAIISSKMLDLCAAHTPPQRITTHLIFISMYQLTL